MTGRDDFDHRLSDWMGAATSEAAPTDGVERAIAASAERRPLPRWFASIGADWVDAARPGQLESRWPSGQRRQLGLIAIVLLMAMAIVGAAVVGARLQQVDRSVVPTAAISGLVMFTVTDDVGVTGERVRDIYAVAENGVPRRIVGVDGDDRDDYCPVLSADGTQLAFIGGRAAAGEADRGYGLVVASIDARGDVTRARTIPIPNAFEPACPDWSPDSQRIALLLPTFREAPGFRPDAAGAVAVVTVATDEVKLMPGVVATDLSWSPDSSEIAIVNAPAEVTLPLVGGSVVIYTNDGSQSRPLPGAENVVSVDWSPDGSRIAYQRIRTPATIEDGGMVAGSETQEIWTVAPDGGGASLQTLPFDVNHGAGPVWSPRGDRLVYQRICSTHPIRPSNPCREQHDVVLLTPGIANGASAPVGQELVVPLVRADAAGGPSLWFPFSVSWSPDGRKLLYWAWSELVVSDGPGDGSSGLVIVDADAIGNPILLYEGAGAGSWSAMPE